jgi:MFS family permease
MAAMRAQILILAASQAIFQTASVIVVTVGSLAGALIASSPSLATLPIAAMLLGTALATFPASAWMDRAGRKTGFVTGALLGAAAGLTAALGVWAGSLPLLCLGTFLVGCWQAFAQFYRFAASEIATETFRSRAISYVLAGGIVAAFAGPWLARLGEPMLKPAYLGSFLLLTLVSLVAAGMLLKLRIPRSGKTEGGSNGRPWRAIVTQPTYAVALFSAATGGGVMILAMTATPLAMVEHRHSLDATATVIQLHVLGMFVPSFFTGTLIARFGTAPVMLAGVVILACHVLITLTGSGFGSFATALTMLGLGWNFLYVGGTTMLTTAYTEAEKGRAQAINDMTIFVVGMTCSFAAGALLNAFGWVAMNLLTLPWLSVAAGALLWHGRRPRPESIDNRPSASPSRH